ncbi:MAG TPA: protein kinase [Polyangiales bacterium]
MLRASQASTVPQPRGLGRYEIERELARGGMGVVYRALDRTTGQALALKRSLVTEGQSPQLSRSMLQREYQTLVALNHPHIIRVYDFGTDEGGAYYTMELLEGADLRSKCPLPWPDVCAYLRDVASSLALLHSRRLIHCDVSVANIWLTKENRAKLLDFGALANFGRNSVIAGSPPTTAPEVLAAEELDQRVDLYALGASAYFALTRRHAYPASTLASLPVMWAQGRPVPPSTYVPGIPPELDELVLGLLEHDRMLRPGSAAEVIDRLEAIAGLTPDQDSRVLRSYLHSRVVVARDAEQTLLTDKLKRALSGRASGVLIEGTTGLGKSLLLSGLEQQARMMGARVLTVHARAHKGALGVWSAILRELGGHDLEPADATRSLPSSADALLELSVTTPLAVTIEDLQEADTDSLAALLSLAKSARASRLFIAGTLDPSHPQAARPALRLLRARLMPVQLAPFDDKATLAFVVGMFGDVPSASRLSTFLHDHSAGNPQTCRAIIDHLIDRGFIRYAQGIWILPSELPVVGPDGLDLGALVKAALESRTAHWRAPLRFLAQCLSPTRSPFAIELCALVAADELELQGQDLALLVGELVHEGVLVDDQGSYTFARKSEQEFFYAQLDDARKRRVHRHLARDLERRTAADPKHTFEAGFHFLLAGEEKNAGRFLNRNIEASLGKLDTFIQSVPDLWALLKHQRAAGASDDEVQFIEGLLVLAAYYVDPSVYDQFGERVTRTMHRTMGFALATRLGRWMPAQLAMTIGLLTAWMRSWFRKPYMLGGSKFSTSVLTFVGICCSMNAGMCSRFELKGLSVLLDLLDITRRLPRLNVLRFLYDQFGMGGDFLVGRIAQGRACLLDQLERLPKLSGVTPDAHHQFELGLVFALGLNSLQQRGDEVPALIERIDALGSKQDQMQAQFLRWQHQLHRGDLAAAKLEEERFDEMSAQFGTRWATDVHSAFAFTPFHLTADVLGLKRTLHRMELVLPLVPNMATTFSIVRAMYEGHRGRPDLALRIYDELGDRIAPWQDCTWAKGTAHKAECLNSLGRHREALAVCEAARAQLSEADRPFVFTYQQLERESALALAGLGRFAEAVELADKLLAECAGSDNLLIRGLLHFDRARIARRAGDDAAFETHALAAKADLAATRNPSGIARVNRLFDATRGAAVSGSDAATDGYTSTLGEFIDPARRSKAERALKEFVTTVEARTAQLYVVVYGRPVLCAQHGAGVFETRFEPDIARVAAKLDRERPAPVVSEALSHVPTELGQTGRLIPLVAPRAAGQSQLVALVALGQCERPDAISELNLVAIANELSEVDVATELAYAGDDSSD